eukprot:TRINITY_DN944_c0_g2_i1.p1 TRINITY_DN944_c0_g2~~TRINITY_DN944_c0_g2_i1.p1  ORF type:complete len:1042 (+),score=381.08 TRINITY_DN944_c0_g2_i1:85-3126(+)
MRGFGARTARLPGRGAAAALRAARRQGMQQALRVVSPDKNESFLHPMAAEFLEAMTQRLEEDPGAKGEVDASIAPVLEAARTDLDLDSPLVSHAVPRPDSDSGRVATPEEIRGAVQVAQMIRAYAVRGHLLCNLDPLGLRTIEDIPGELEPEYFGFSEADMDRQYYVRIADQIGGVFAQTTTLPLREVISRLRETYCGKIGWEFMHISDPEKTRWLRERIEFPRSEEVSPSAERRKQIHEDLAQGVLFERFLHTKYTTHKRFGLDGGESLIPGMRAVLDKAAAMGVKNICIGMPHRGRLSVLANVCGKSLTQILHEFEGHVPDDKVGSGDVKYHLGVSIDRQTRAGVPIHVSLVANPSHLETVDPVVAGKARAKQRYAGDLTGQATIPIQLHGDAAFSGQGVCYETMGLGDLYRYSCSGTIHIVVNNQIGFTTDPQQHRSSPYCTDIAKQGHPVFHVNGDDPESVVRVMEIAVEYRQKFRDDVVIDLVCYRRFGHNETDEPMFTQPVMYKTIKKHPVVLGLYEDKLKADKVLGDAEVKNVHKRINAEFRAAFAEAKDYVPQAHDWLDSHWDDYKTPGELASLKQTGVDLSILKGVGKKLCTYPEDFNLHPTLRKIVQRKQESIESGEGIEWGTAEQLAFATLLLEGNHVRLSGQDVERGTFSQRHLVAHDQVTGAKHCPLGQLHKSASHFEVCNSSLSEYGVLGFETGYAMENPASLVLWEAQFGDFANGAQVIYDQYLSSSEAKWSRSCGLVTLLPHGYDGMGPEHSSCRLERWLIMSDEDEYGPKVEHAIELKELGAEVNREIAIDNERQVRNTNWQVCYPSTPAQYFHLLRRQVHREFRKPLVVAVSKAFLRAPNVSTLDELTPSYGGFKHVIDDNWPDLVVPRMLVKRVAFCSGQIYHHAAAERAKRGCNDIALVRIEQLAPFPFREVAQILDAYTSAEFVWLQEEPRNMGAWSHFNPRFRNIMKAMTGGELPKKPRYIGRAPAASPATGFKKVHDAEHSAIMDELFNY